MKYFQKLEYKNFNWKTGIFIVSYHLALFIGLPFYLFNVIPKASLLLATFLLLFLNGISISAGYHRYYAHKAYTPSKVVESILLFFSTMAMQGSVIYWSHEHRIHHRFTDKEEDPHSIKKGFLYAHVLWLFKKPKPIDEMVVQDLTKNKLVRFQHSYYVPLAIATNLVAVIFVWWLTQDLAGALIMSFLLRIFLLHHFTWFINSLAHTWGAKTYSGEQTAVDNYIIALVTFGEGYHNYHHVFASDYRNGIRWYHFDPSKWLVWILCKIGLVKDLKKMNQYTIKKTIILEDKKILLEKIRESVYEQKEALENKVHEMSENLLTKLSHANILFHEYYKFKKIKDQKDAIRKQIKEFKLGVNESWKAWSRLTKDIMSLPNV